jgi:PAS domain S-box-containing protein
MAEAATTVRFPRAAAAVLAVFVLVAGALLSAGPADYPYLHTILDTCVALLSAMLALVLWDQGVHSDRPFPKWLAVTFAATFLLNIVHVLVTVEWSGSLAAISRARGFLRPATWGPPAHLLPIGIGLAFWRLGRGQTRVAGHLIAVFILTVTLFLLFQNRRTYLAPGLLGITRPTLLLPPFLWAAVGLTGWRLRAKDPILRPIVWMAAVLAVANGVMLYSRAPADSPAMIAHLGRIAGHLVLLLTLVQMAANDMRERIRAEARLARLNRELDQRVLDRTAALAAANQDLEREMAARRQSQQLLEAVVTTSPAVIYVKDLEGRYLMVNKRYADIFHVDKDAMVGRTDHDIFPAPQADAFRAMDQRVAAADQPLTEQETAPHDDGPHTYISLKSPLRDETGRPYAVFGISTDITEHKRAQDALAASEERTRLIVETALDAVVAMDGAGRITGWSPQAERIFGWTSDEAVGRPVDETIMPERYREGHRRGLERYLTTGETAVLGKRIELTAVRRTGAEFPIELAITPIRTGDTVTFAGFIRDITGRKQAEARLQTQLERLALLDGITRAIGQRQDTQSIFQVMVRTIEEELPADFVCLCLYDDLDRALTVEAVGVGSQPLALNLAMPEKARIPIDENGLSRCVLGQLVYEADIAELPFPFPERLARGSLRSLVAAPLQVESKVFGVLVVARFAADGFVSAECEFLRQVSEHGALALHQAQLYAALQTAYDDLRQSQQTIMQQERLRALGQMASGIAHDINNALSPVALYTESMLETEQGLSSGARHQLEVIRRAVDDVARTIARMREFYRPRGPERAATSVRMNDLVQQVLDLTKVRWKDMAMQRGAVITVGTELAADLPMVSGVENEIREALTNLVFNAVDALPDGGEIVVRTRRADGAVRLEVSDNGVGMDAETRRRCLEPFFTTKGERGTGLGLAMVYGVVERHGGEVDIVSTPGEGSTFVLSFAVAAPQARAGNGAKVDTALPRMRLLLVDDDPVLLKALGDALTADGHDITIANDGQAGIRAFSVAEDDNACFDAVITDLGMPHVDGRRVAAAVKAISPKTPVILLTGWGRGLLADNDIPPHVDQVLGKPPRLQEIRAALAKGNGEASR